MDREVKIFAQLPQQKIELIGSLSEADYPLIRNRIVGHTQGGTKELVTELLLKAKWVIERDERNIFIPVIETFMQIPGINLKKLAEFVKNKEKQTFFTKYLESKKTFNLYEMFEQNLEGIFPPESLKQLVDQLWTITTCVKQIGVGPGEICLSLLTDAQKGNKGDLLMTKIGDVEVKSTYGRLGSGDNALQFVPKVRKILKLEEKCSWNTALKQVFYSKKTLTDLCESLTWVSTQKLPEEKYKQLKLGLKSIFDHYPIMERLLERDRKILTQLVLSVQLSTYQSDNNFTHLLSVNKKTKDCYSFYFPAKTVDKNIFSIYSQINEIGRFGSNLAIDSNGMRKGVEINFN